MNKNLILLQLALLLTATAAAHDFEVDSIYYNINPDGTTVTVTYQGTDYNSASYSGYVDIPKTVSYNGTSYSVTAIGDYAFYGCNQLGQVVINDRCQRIGSKAFYNCSRLSIIKCKAQDPPSISSNTFLFNSEEYYDPRIFVLGLAYDRYQNAENWQDLNLWILNYDFEVDDICYYISSDSTVAVANNNGIDSDWPISYYSGEVTIPEKCVFNGATYTVIGIGMWAFHRSSVTKVNLPNSITFIGQEAFAATGISSITIPKNVISIGSGVLSQTNLSQLIWNAKNCNPSCEENYFDSYLRNLIIGKDVEKIPDIFKYNYISTIVVDSLNPLFDSRDNCNAIIETASNTFIFGCYNSTIPNSITSIGKEVFGFYGPNSVSIPSSVTYISDNAFKNIWFNEIHCLAFTPPTMGNSYCFESYTYSDAVLKVPRNSIEAYRTTDYWNLFNNITGIEEPIGFFEEDGILYYAESEGTATVMQNKDMENYYSGDVVIPENVVHDGVTYLITGIENNAFDGCYELTSVVIPNSVENIGEQAFQGCTGLKSVTIGSGVTTIGSKAFNYCNALETVKCIGTVPPVMASSDCFTTATYNHAQLLVPHQSIESYQAADYWYKFASIEGWGSAGPGDVDGDGYVTINDATSMIDVMLGGGSEDFYFESSDFNNNGRVDIADVVTLIDYLLNGYY